MQNPIMTMVRIAVSTVVIIALAGCMSALFDNDITRRIRDEPLRGAYQKYSQSARAAERTLRDARIPYEWYATNESLLMSKIAWAYAFAATDALGFAQDVYDDPADAARVRATTDARISNAAAIFAANRDTIKKVCDNYSQVFQALERANELGTQAMALK